MLSPSEFRAHFPLLSRRVYLNSCSQGALSREVEDAFGAFLASWHDRGSPWDLWVGKVEELRAAFARSIGADVDEVAVVPSASAGINAIASALRFGGTRSGVVIGELEFPTMGHVWLAQRRRGAQVTWLKADNGRLEVDRYGAVVDETTAVVPASHVSFLNGFRVDVAGVAAVCHERGAYLFVDDYQRTGTAPIDVHQLGVDFLVTGSLKYLLGPSGVAYLYVRRKLIDRLEPLFTGWFGRVNPFDFMLDRLDWSPSARRFETGTPTVVNAWAALAALQLLEQVGWAEIERHIAHLVDRFISRAGDEGWNVLTPADAARRGPLVVLGCRDAAELARRLEARAVIVSARGSGVRASFHAYNNEQDVEAAIEAIRAESELLEKAE
jgi:selenocysteine lyase/cysteine desulfurase